MGLEPSILFDPGGVWILWENHLMNHFKHNKNLTHKDDTPPLVDFRWVWNLPFTTPQISLISSNKTHPSRLNKLQPTSLWKRKTEKTKQYTNLTHLADCFSCSFIAAKKHSHHERLQRHRYHPRSKCLFVKAFQKFTVKISVQFFWGVVNGVPAVVIMWHLTPKNTLFFSWEFLKKIPQGGYWGYNL